MRTGHRNDVAYGNFVQARCQDARKRHRDVAGCRVYGGGVS